MLETQIAQLHLIVVPVLTCCMPPCFVKNNSSESEEEANHEDFPGVLETNSGSSLQDVLTQLACEINEDKISKFNISRSHLWEGALRGLRRKSFSPESKVSVKFTDDSGTPEGAVDLGGPKREFFTLVMEWMMNSQLFCGTEKNKYLSCNSNYLGDDFYFYAGELIAMSVVHGGPGPKCFGLPLYDALTKGVMQTTVNLEDVYDVELRNSLQRLKDAKIVKEAQNLISEDNLEKVLELAGILQILRKQDDVLSVVQNTAHWFVLGRRHACFERFKAGLSTLGVLGAMTEHYEKFKEVFCYSNVQLNADLFDCLFTINYSDEGSNNRQRESLVLSHWRDYLQDVEDQSVEITFSDILFFVTGLRKVPPCGLALQLSFLHEPEGKDNIMSTFPMANACACKLRLPVTHASYDDFKKDLTFAFLNTKDYGYA